MRQAARLSQVCIAAALAGSILAALPNAALAGGFGIEQSAYFQGMSYAGAAAGGESLAAIAWNPATATFAGSGLLMEATASGLLISADVTVSNPGAQISPTGAAETDMGRNALIGASFFTYRLDSKTVVALSLTSPFGLGTKPNDTNWVGQFEGITTYVFNVNATPIVSYEVVPGVSVAAGVQIDYFGLKRQTAQTPLGLANFQADDVGVGGVAGITVVPMPGTSIGLGYRSTINHKLEGHTELGAIAKTDAHASVMLPEMVSLGVRHAVSPTTRLLGEVEWVNWSRLGVIPIVINEPIAGIAPAGTTVANLDFQWRDGWLFSIGGEYDWSRDLTLRTGVAYEVSPVDGPTTRLVQDPDSNRVWLSLGGSYDWDKYTRLDFSYSHVFYENNAPFNRVPASTLFTGPPLLGTADLSMDVFSVGFKTDLNAVMSSLH
ncbi:MAG TPA: outer membrane protein transport protein [Hyphomicrobium sp.]